jgi:Domain of unknown function (DUF4337)/NHL repeat
LTASTARAIFAATVGVSMIAAVLVVAFSRDAFAQADLALMSAMTPGSAGDTTADVVIGQADFTHNGANNLDSTGLWLPNAVAVDAAGHLFVADTNNSRVLGFANASSFLNGAAAQVVLGQIDFQSGQCNAGSAALFQVAIALGAMAALRRVRPVWYASIVVGLSGAVLFIATRV